MDTYRFIRRLQRRRAGRSFSIGVVGVFPARALVGSIDGYVDARPVETLGPPPAPSATPRENVVIEIYGHTAALPRRRSDDAAT